MSDSFTNIELAMIQALVGARPPYVRSTYRLRPILQDRAEHRPFMLDWRDRADPLLVAASKLTPERAGLVLAAIMIQTG